MSNYARVDSVTLQASPINITDAEYHLLDGNPKQQWVRPLVVDARPVPTATQVVQFGGLVVEPAQVRATWVLRDKTQAELNADANTADAPNIKAQAVIDNLTTRIQLDRTGFTAAQHIAQLESDVLVLLKIARYFVRGLV